MATKSKLRTTAKTETWEEKEARLLCKAVYDHLAYYIQVQLPEDKFVSTNHLQSSASRKSSNSQATRKKGIRTKRSVKITNREPSAVSSDSIPGSATTNAGQGVVPKEKTKKQGGSRKKLAQTRTTSVENSCDIRRPQSRYEKSPYLEDVSLPNIGRKKRTAEMRREAERVTCTTSQLLRNISLDEIMAVQKYRSPCKSLIRCSSSLSDHPNGMLTSNKAVKYAAEHDDREAARKYVQQKRKKQRHNTRRDAERERRQLVSSRSYRQKNRSPSKIALNETESSSSDDEFSDSSSTSSYISSQKSETQCSGSTDSAYCPAPATPVPEPEEKSPDKTWKSLDDTKDSETSRDESISPKTPQSTKEKDTTIEHDKPLSENYGVKKLDRQIARDDEGRLEKAATLSTGKPITISPVPKANEPMQVAQESTPNAESNDSKRTKSSASSDEEQSTAVDDSQAENTTKPEKRSTLRNSMTDVRSQDVKPSAERLSKSNADSVTATISPENTASTESLQKTYSEESSASDDESSTTSSIRRLINEARSSLSALGGLSSDQD